MCMNSGVNWFANKFYDGSNANKKMLLNLFLFEIGEDDGYVKRFNSKMLYVMKLSVY